MFLYKIYVSIFPNKFNELICNFLKEKIYINNTTKLNIVDIGCYIGNFSLNLSSQLKYLKCKKFFYLIDPNIAVKKYLKYLKFNFKFFRLAIDNSNKKKFFYLNNFFAPSGSSLNKITVNDNLWNFSRKILTFNIFKNYSKLLVQCQSLDNFVKKNKIKKIHILKFDTEGNELNILKGAKKTLKNTSIIYFEILSQKKSFRGKFKKINNILTKNNFLLCKKKRIITVSFFSNLTAYDFLYFKNSEKVKNKI